MKNIIGTITIGKSHKRDLIRVYFKKNLSQVLGGEIIFNIDNLTMRKPDIDSKKISSIRNKVINISASEDTINALTGKYNVIQKDEDTFKLKRCLETV